ncbi:MAG: hypothetical protein CVV25_07110 [Ignavibacteriae bacterium HGW-Ignavibacteriae-4]|jgi:hypothetical protein|nr:MAG: hypothetical protein CVV25_07110 [Ignavibacteriae bacterium HGW-Ignavibacteriae-4]
MKNFILFLLLFPILALAQIPQTMNYQGRLEDNSGNPVTDGNYSIVFSIFDAPTNGNSLWTETRSVTTEDGFFTLTLGENTAIDINTDQQIWLNINIGGNDLTPRTKLSGSLSSLSTKAVENTTSAGNSVVTSINTSAGGVDAAKIADGSVSDTEFQHLDGVTSDIQTQIDGKQATITGNLDAALIADGSVSNTEFQYLDGVYSDIQSQLDQKQQNLPSQLGHGGQYLFTDGDNLYWQAVSGGSSLPEVTELGVGSTVIITTNSYVNFTDTQPTLVANATYLIKGVLGAKRSAGSTALNFKLNYSGTTKVNIFTCNSSVSKNDGIVLSYPLNGSLDEHYIDGIISTTDSGTLSLQAAISSGSNTIDMTTATKIFLIRVK